MPDNNLLSVGLPTGSGITTYPPGASFGPRHLRDFEFVWLIDGSGIYHRGDLAVQIPAGSILLCQPHTSDYFKWDTSRRTRHAYFHFTIESIPDDWPSPDQWPVTQMLPEEDIIRPLFRRLLTRQGNEDLRQTLLTIAQILTAFVRGSMATGHLEHANWPDAVERACAYIQTSIQESPERSITLAELAAAAHVSSEHLCRLFGASTGHSPMAMARLVRLDHAVPLLLRSNCTVAEVSDYYGFANPFHFSRQFKKAFGCTPTQLREMARAGADIPQPCSLAQIQFLDV